MRDLGWGMVCACQLCAAMDRLYMDCVCSGAAVLKMCIQQHRD
jgi:hypothetical protein